MPKTIMDEERMTVKELRDLLDPFPNDATIQKWMMGGYIGIELPDGDEYTIDMNDGEIIPHPYVGEGE